MVHNEIRVDEPLSEDRAGAVFDSLYDVITCPFYPRDQPTIILLCSRLKVSLIIRNGWGWGRAPLDAFPSMSG